MTTNAEAVAAQIENAAENAETAIDAANEIAESAIEAAAEQVEAAEDAAQAIAEAAMLTELGKRVQDCIERAEQWHHELIQKTENQALQILSLENQLAAMAETLAALQPPSMVVVTETLPTSETSPTAEAVETIVAALPVSSDQSAPISGVTAPPRKRMRLI